jgi:hypothetical protein
LQKLYQQQHHLQLTFLIMCENVRVCHLCLMQACAHSRFKNSMFNREVHYNLFTERDFSAAGDFPAVSTRLCSFSTTRNSDLNMIRLMIMHHVMTCQRELHGMQPSRGRIRNHQMNRCIGQGSSAAGSTQISKSQTTLFVSEMGPIRPKRDGTQHAQLGAALDVLPCVLMSDAAGMCTFPRYPRIRSSAVYGREAGQVDRWRHPGALHVHFLEKAKPDV